MQAINQYAGQAKQYARQCAGQARQLANRCVEGGREACASLYGACSSGKQFIFDAEKGVLCIFLVHYFVKNSTPLLSLQMSLTFGVASLVHHFAAARFEILKQEPCDAGIGAYTNPAFYRNMARTLVLVAAGCAISACVMGNPLLLQLTSRIVATQAIAMFCCSVSGYVGPAPFLV